MTFPQTIDPAQANKETPIQEDLRTLRSGSVYGRRDAAVAGLQWAWHGGDWNGFTPADGTQTLGASTTTYMVVLRSTGAVSFSTSNTNWNSGLYARCYALTTGAGSITASVDWRDSINGTFDHGSSSAPVTSVAGKTGAVTLDHADISDFSEAVDDRVGALMVGVNGVRITYDDAGNVINVDASEAVNAQTGTSYTYLTGDRGKLVSHSNAAAIAGTLPQAGSTGFPANWLMDVQNRGAGTLTITPATSTIDGAASLVLTTGQGARVVSDGTNWFTQRGIGAAGGITALTGDVTASGPGSATATIANDAVTNAKLANMATATIKGRTTAGTGDPEDLTAAQAAAILGANVKSTESIIIACSDESTALTAGTAKITFRMPYAFTLTDVRASVTTAPTGGTLLTVDINESGTTILSTKLTFDASEKTTTTAATPRVISDTSLADDAEMTVDIDAVGSTVAGTGLKVYLIGTRT
jgi:hypothetical protein